MIEGFDVIGDVHGYAGALVDLLAALGYREQHGIYSQPHRQAIFVGDLIDRGRENFRVLKIVKAMCAAGQARVVLGNHEYNALCYHTPAGDGRFLRSHSEKNQGQHRETLEEIARHGDAAWQVYLEWFRTRPLFLELAGLRVVHACWDRAGIDLLTQAETRDSRGRLTDRFLQESSRPGSAWFLAVENLLKGMEISLPQDHLGIIDKDGHPRKRVRVKWWLPEEAWGQVKTYDQVARTDGHTLEKLTGIPMPAEILKELQLNRGNRSQEEIPILFGHFWFTGEPLPQTPYAACLDYSVARGGKLVCYRWDGNPPLDKAKFFWLTGKY